MGAVTPPSATTGQVQQPIAPDSGSPDFGTAWPEVEGAPAGVVNPHVVRGTDEGLLLVGGLSLGAGYLLSVLAGVLDETGANCNLDDGGTAGEAIGCGTWPYALVPFGGWVPALTHKTVDSPTRHVDGALFALGITSAAAQLAGAIVLAFALAGYTEELVSEQGVALTLMPGPGLGASIGLRF